MKHMQRSSKKGPFVLVAGILLLTISLVIPGDAGKIPGPQNQLRIPELTSEKTEKMVDVGGRELHCILYGQGEPTVVLISGFNAPQETWNAIIPALAETATVVTYDRAGIGKSTLRDLPAHGKQSALDLHVLLEKLDLPEPYVLVGHSYGVRVVRLYASIYPDTVGGMVFLDGQHPDILDEQKKVLSGDDLARLEQMEEMMKPRGNPRTERDYVYESLEQDKQITSLPKVPCVLVSAGARREGGLPPGFSDKAVEKLTKVGLEMQKRLVQEIPGTEHIILDDAGHFVHLEKPEKVISIILELIMEVRSPQYWTRRKS
ncbi:MAG: alpha/beta hydrolase [Candidatus Aminicenantes bacterium]|nr:alpha/beta hydrolase [Candidatus Aminicenantes bacterium]